MTKINFSAQISHLEYFSFFFTMYHLIFTYFTNSKIIEIQFLSIKRKKFQTMNNKQNSNTVSKALLYMSFQVKYDSASDLYSILGVQTRPSCALLFQASNIHQNKIIRHISGNFSNHYGIRSMQVARMRWKILLKRIKIM